jgi:hypothetical protein
MAVLIQDFLKFSIHDLKRLGMLRDGYRGSLSWNQNGKVTSTIGFAVWLSDAVPEVMLRYTLTQTGRMVVDRIKLHFQKSNLNNQAGYWMFVCPITNLPCRVLYLHDGHFKSRKAMPPGTIYKCQTYYGTFKGVYRAFDYSDAVAALNTILQKPYGKTKYRGKPTRKTKRLIKLENRYADILESWLYETPDRINDPFL